MDSGWKVFFCVIIIWLGVTFDTTAREHNSDSAMSEKVEELIAFLQFSLNTIGSPLTTAREKDIIITQSYSKFFRDEDVQVEDDLDEDRETVTNKDVQAYLKDIDFFFKKVSFDLEIEDIEELVSESGQVVYLVRLNRNLNGITIDDDTVNQSLIRYIEINYDEEEDDLKIVSFYTTKLSESEDLQNWWKGLSFEWRYLFTRMLGDVDSVTLAYLKRADAIDSLDLSDNPYLSDIEPVRRLGNLHYLDLSNTKILDLSPLRSHTKLGYVSIQNTGISNIDFLRYSKDLQVLDLAGSEVKDLRPLRQFPNLVSLNLSHTPVDSLQHLEVLKRLEYLDCSYSKVNKLDGLENIVNLRSLNVSFTQIENLEKIRNLSSLVHLNFEFTTIDNLSPIADLNNVEIIKCENTNVYDLKQLNGLINLKRIYCDNTGISLQVAAEYMRLHPQTLIVFESEELHDWWLGLNSAWKDILKNTLSIIEEPEREELARISNIDSLNLDGLKSINDLTPVKSMRYLKYLNCNDTYIRDLAPISGLDNLEILSLAETAIEDLNPISEMRQLRNLDVSNSRVKDIGPIDDLRYLSNLNLDGTLVDENDIRIFIQRNPACQVIYKTEFLNDWWDELNDLWREVFRDHLPEVSGNKDRYLHNVILLKRISISGMDIEDLSPLNELFQLNEISIDGALITDLSPLSLNPDLIKISITRCPLYDVTPLQSLPDLYDLNLSQTALSDLTVVSNLDGLTSLSLAGTKIRSLKLIENMENLEKLDISNTSVKKLNQITVLPGIKHLICYNTPLNIKKIDKFRLQNPDCQVIFY